MSQTDAHQDQATEQPQSGGGAAAPSDTPGGPIQVRSRPAEDPEAAPEAALESEEERMPRMTLGEHLEDLRKRLFYSVLGLAIATTACLIFGRHILGWIEAPYHIAIAEVAGKLGEKANYALKFTDVTGPFTMYLRICVYAGLVLASPWIFYHIWAFVGAGLYRRERRWVMMAVPFSVLLFVAGAAFAVLLSAPAIKFFVLFGADLRIEPIITLTEYVDFMTNLLLAFGVVFQMPLVVLILAKVGLVDMTKLNQYRRHVLVIIAIIAAVLAPPDVLSMLAMVLPMWVLYEFGVLLAWAMILRKRKARAQVEDAG